MILAASPILVISASVIAFLIIILILVSTLLYARSKLSSEGQVKIIINDEKELVISQGNTLLGSLSGQGVFLPSACGGGGTCGLCRCQVTEGGGSILVTEMDHFTRKEQHSNWRLGCQVKVRGDMKIIVPEEVLGIKKWECEVISNRNVATFIN
jgi:Na+-transporting NADH:ubiquinone oxidoreductase subunit F